MTGAWGGVEGRMKGGVESFSAICLVIQLMITIFNIKVSFNFVSLNLSGHYI